MIGIVMLDSTYKRHLKRKIRNLRSSLYKYGLKLPKSKQMKEILKKYEICLYCSEKIQIDDYSPDHILPLDRGGSNTIDNIQFICIGCNRMKGNLTDEEFKWFLSFLKQNNEVYTRIRKRLRASGFMYFSK